MKIALNTQSMVTVLGMLLALVGCTNPPSVPYTTPANGAFNVPVSSTVEVAFSTAMDPGSSTDSSNWSIQGSLSGAHTSVGALDTDQRVLTLTLDEAFHQGETITVVISDGVKTAVNIPIEPITIHFTTEGAGASSGDFEAADDEFSLFQLNPTTGTRSIPLRPSVTAHFDLPYQTSSAAQGIFLQGTRTGWRDVQLAHPGHHSGIADTLQLLIAGNTPELHPGEWLQVVFSQDLLSEIQPDEDEPRFLNPYVARFRARLGHATGGLGPRESLAAAGTDAVLAAELGEFLPYSGLEMLVVGSAGDLRLLRSGSSGEASSWTIHSQLQLDSIPVALLLVDIDADSRTEALISCVDGTIRIVGVQGQDLIEEQDPVDLQGVVADALAWAELNGDGLPDLLVGAADGLRVMRQITMIDPATFEVTEELTVTGLMPLGGPVQSISVADFDRDGKIDALVSAGDGYLLRGAGNGSFLEAALLSPAPQGPIVLGDVDGDGWMDAVAVAATGLSIHLHPGTLPEGTWEGIPLLTGGLVEDLAVGEVDGDPVNIDDIVVLQSGTTDPLTLIRRHSADLGDSTITPLEYTNDPAAGSLLLVDSDGDRGTDILLQLSQSDLSGSLALWRSAAVVSADESMLIYGLPAQVSVGPGEPQVEVPLTAEFEQDVSRFNLAIEFDQDLLQLMRIEADPATFPFGSVEVIEYIDQENGVAAAELVINGYLSAGSGLPIARFIFQPQPSMLGEATYQLADGLLIDGTPWSNQAILEVDGALIGAEISAAQGVVSIESTTPSPEELTCQPASVGGVDGVFLEWTNPISYDSLGGLEIYKNGVLLAALTGTATSFTDDDTNNGTLLYSLIGLSSGIESVPVPCQVTVIPVPDLQCQRLVSLPQRVFLSWGFISGAVSWELSRDGNVLAQLGSTQLSYNDDTDLNAHDYQLKLIQTGSQSSAGAPCSVDDAGGGATVPPSGVSAVLVGDDDVRISWFNGESYDQLQLLADGVLVTVLAGNETEYVANDQFPGLVVFSVQAFGDGGASNVSHASELNIPLAPPTTVQCSSSGNSVELTWQNGPTAFDYDEIVVERTGTLGSIEYFTLEGTSTSFTDFAGAGEWSYTVVGDYFNQGLNHPAPSAACTISLSERVFYESTTTVIGRPFSIDLQGQLLEQVSGWSLVVDYDSTRLQDVSVFVPGVSPAGISTTDEPLGTFAGLRRLTLQVEGASAAPSSSAILGILSGTVPADFSLIGSALCHIVSATLEPATGGPSTEPALQDGVVIVSGNALFLDSAVLNPGEEVVVWARGVWQQDLTGYSVVLQWDPSILTCLEVSNIGTVGENLSGPFSAFFSGIEASAGTAFGSVISAFSSIPSSLGAELGYFRFMVSPGAPQGLTTEVIFGEHLTANSSITNIFVDDQATSIEPTTLGAEFVVLSDPQPPTLLSIAPNTGPVAGGTDVLFNGTGFTADTGVFFGDQPALTVIVIDTGTILATTPAAPSGTAGSVDVSIFTPYGSVTLDQEFSYYQVSIDGYDPAQSPLCGMGEMTVTGTGLPTGLGVVFGNQPASSVVVNAAGTSATVVIPASDQPAVVDLIFVDNFGSVLEAFPAGFSYIDDGIFIRGDATCDGAVNIADVAAIAGYVAGAGSTPVILDTADIDDNGVVHIGDAVLLASFLFSGGTPPAIPFPNAGTDPTPDGL
ncbi:MAG: Ig-like domain-containing protein [Planctomycetota bacterium]|nr:Ig-like domain-containing protein [Planctomycetota bacterium]